MDHYWFIISVTFLAVDMPTEAVLTDVEQSLVATVTTETVPGHEIAEVLGIARGNTVRARNVGRDITQGLEISPEANSRPTRRCSPMPGIRRSSGWKRMHSRWGLTPS